MESNSSNSLVDGDDSNLAACLTNALMKTEGKRQNTPEFPPPGIKTGEQEVISHEGGCVFEVSPVTRILRYVCIGVDKTIYQNKKEIHSEVMEVLVKAAKSESTVMKALLAIKSADEKRCLFKQEGALTAVAVFARLAASTRAKRLAWIVAQCLIRTLDHWSIFLSAYTLLRRQIPNATSGWGRMPRKAVASWFESKNAVTLANLFTKYTSRSGVTGNAWKWSDILRLGHPKAKNDAQRLAFEYVVS